MNAMHNLKVSALYFDDHVECAEDFQKWCASIVKYSKDGRYVWVSLDDDQLADLADRADYYSISFGLDPEYVGLGRSAKAVCRQIAAYKAAQLLTA